MAQSSYKKNILYNSIYRCVVILTPLVTSPYLSRVLGVEKLGLYSAANAFATYFVIFSLLGVNDYGNRTIAQVRGDRNKLSDEFWQIYYLQFFLTLILLVVYLIWIQFRPGNISVRLILAIYVFSSFFEVNWFAFGMEEFRLTSIRSIITRLGIVACIFAFVKSSDDLWKYTLIITGGNLVSLLVILPLIFKYTDFRAPDVKKIISHIRPNLMLFLPVIATSAYQQLSKLMLEAWSAEAEVGFYQYAENIVTLPTFVTTAIVTVMLPYASNLVARGEKDENRTLFYTMLKYTSILNVAMTFGMLSIAGDFIPWYLGSGFERSALLTMIMSPMIFFSGFSGIVRYQYMIPNEYDRENLISLFAGAGADILLNILLIPSFGACGAAVSTAAAYAVTLLVQMIFLRKEINTIKIIRSFLPGVFFGCVMCACVFCISQTAINIMGKVLLELVVGALVFTGLTGLWLYKTDDGLFKNLLSKAKERLTGN